MNNKEKLVTALVARSGEQPQHDVEAPSTGLSHTFSPESGEKGQVKVVTVSPVRNLAPVELPGGASTIGPLMRAIQSAGTR